MNLNVAATEVLYWIFHAVSFCVPRTTALRNLITNTYTTLVNNAIQGLLY